MKFNTNEIHKNNDKLAEEKEYIYKHILDNTLRVENIRGMIYQKHKRTEAEELINECLQFAFKYVNEIKFTDDDYDEEESNTYAVKNGKTYMYTIKNKEVIYNEEKEGYTFKDYDRVVFKAHKYSLLLFRDGKKISAKPWPVGRKPVYVLVHGGRNITYELSVDQQIKILEQEDNIRKISEEEIRTAFIKDMKQENEITTEVNEAINSIYENIDVAYEQSEAVRLLAKLLYKEGRIHQHELYAAINAVLLENKVDKNKIRDIIICDDSTMKEYDVYEDKYKLSNLKSKNIQYGVGFESKDYSYRQNCEYTEICHTSAYIDSFSLVSVILEGQVKEEESILLYEYAYASEVMKSGWKFGYLYEEEWDTYGNGNTHTVRIKI